MSETVTNEVIKSIRADLQQMKGDVRDLKESLISGREEIHALRGDILRQERSMAAFQVHIDRVNARLELNDPTH